VHGVKLLISVNLQANLKKLILVYHFYSFECHLPETFHLLINAQLVFFKEIILFLEELLVRYTLGPCYG
jgi:hypothetical protein